MGSWFERAFEGLRDPRTGNAKRHDLLELLVIALTASVCGAESCSDFADFAVDREDLFREFLCLENGVPSHDTFSRVFRLLDPGAFARCFARFVEDLGARGDGVLAIDGKTLRRSFDDAARSNPLAVVTAFCSASRMLLGQQSFRVAEGHSEILAARKLLECLDLTGMLVTADALHCQGETARIIRDSGGDYLLRLKRNRPELHTMVVDYFADPQTLNALAQAETTDGNHGRIEQRRAFVSHDLAWLRGPKNATTEPLLLPDMACIGMIEARVERNGKTTVTRHYHLSSRQLAPEAYLEAARAHWSIENGYTGCSMSASTRTGPATAKTMDPKISLPCANSRSTSSIAPGPVISVRRKRKRAGWSNDFARSIIGQMR